MKLDYKILWLDDKIKSVVLADYEEDIDELKVYIKSLGFNETIDFVRTEEELFSKLGEVGEYDLIMTDYHLDEINGVSRNGDDIIKTIREKDIFTEIMFYSAQGEVKDTDRLDRITFFESFRVLGNDHYEKIFNKAKDLIELTVRKFQHIVAMRGMIMNETSDLDMQMLNIIKQALKSQNISFDELAPKIYDELNELYDKKNRFVNECRDTDKFIELTKDNFVFSADYKIKTLGQILGSLNVEDFSSEYKDEINSMRNKFAHAVLLEDEHTGRKFFKHGESGLTFDEELCKKIRTDITKHRNNLNKISEALSQSQ